MIRNASFLAPERVSLAEAAWCGRQGLKSIKAVKLALRRRRLEQLPTAINGRTACWALVIPPHELRRLIEDGRLEVSTEDADGGRWRRVIMREDLEQLAEELS